MNFNLNYFSNISQWTFDKKNNIWYYKVSYTNSEKILVTRVYIETAVSGLQINYLLIIIHNKS